MNVKRNEKRERTILLALMSVNGGAVTLKYLISMVFGLDHRKEADCLRRDIANLRGDGHQIELWHARTPFAAYQLI